MHKRRPFNTNGLQNFVLSKRNIEDILKNRIDINLEVQKPVKESKPIIVHEKDFLIPRFDDTLFWCFYIIQNGISSYELIHQKEFREEKSYKIAMVGKVRESKELLKKYKWKRRQIEDELVNQKKISTKVFLCLCAMHDINVCLINGQTAYTFTSSDSSSNVQILNKTEAGYEIFIGTLDERQMKLNTCRNTCWCIDSLSKPLRGISSYKIKDLQDICRKLNLSIYNEGNKKRKKSDLYQLIRQSL